MTGTLEKRNVFLVGNLFPFGIMSKFRNEQSIRIRDISSSCVLTAIKNRMTFILQLLPLKRHFLPADIIAFPVLPHHIK